MCRRRNWFCFISTIKTWLKKLRGSYT